MILSFDGRQPRLDSTAFVAAGAQLIGDIEIGAESSIWYNCVLRADVHHIRIGARSNIQDGTVIHVDSDRGAGAGPRPTLIGDDVLIGHLAMIHGAVLRDRAFVGMCAIIMDAEIESDGMLAAGAMLTAGKRIGARQLWVGRPARYLRDLSDEEVAANRAGVAGYVENARAHRATVREAQASR
ncbi:MAG TPA: gamma carbonic anhydrase family protein [Allosphingosinicella sp.]|nr:gamma carbonic anhydrase family protein [Allosphingosinicella sp.]